MAKTLLISPEMASGRNKRPSSPGAADFTVCRKARRCKAFAGAAMLEA